MIFVAGSFQGYEDSFVYRNRNEYLNKISEQKSTSVDESKSWKRNDDHGNFYLTEFFYFFILLTSFFFYVLFLSLFHSFGGWLYIQFEDLKRSSSPSTTFNVFFSPTIEESTMVLFKAKNRPTESKWHQVNCMRHPFWCLDQTDQQTLIFYVNLFSFDRISLSNPHMFWLGKETVTAAILLPNRKWCSIIKQPADPMIMIKTKWL